MSLTPANVGTGGALAYAGGDDIYATRGANSTNFWGYSISGNSWSSLTGTSANVGAGGALTPDGGDTIYALRGNSTGFWRYSIAGDGWAVLTNTPATVGVGARLAYVDGSGVYALRGAETSDYWQYAVGAPPQYDVVAQAAGTSITARVEIDGTNVTVLTWDIQ